MKDEIKQALGKATIGPWEFAVFEDSRHVIYDSTYLNRHIAEIVKGGVENEQREEDNAFLIANAPTWLKWQNERIEQLEKALKELRASVYGIGSIVNVAVGYGEELDYGLLSTELNRIADEASQALGKEE